MHQRRQWAPGNKSKQQGRGYAQVFSGKTGKQLFPDVLGDAPGDGFGFSVGGVGDVNGDGLPDFAVGAAQTPGFSNRGSGYVRVFSGKTGKPLYTLAARGGESLFGTMVAGRGDVTGDGRPDIAVTGLIRKNRSPVPSLFIYSGVSLTLTTDTHELPLTKAGTQTLSLDAGAAHANRPYFVLGSATGTRTGVQIGGVKLPLDYDVYSIFTLFHPNSSVLQKSLGLLDASGRGKTLFQVPSGLPSLKGFTLFHAYLVADSRLRVVMASNAVPLRLY